MKINIKPLADRVLLEPLEAETKTASGIIIPDNAKEKPQINKSDDDYSFNAPKEIIDDDYFMTETLAKLYLKQKNYEKAIQSYKILILKFPEKNSYFADQIKKIKSLKK